MISFTENFEFPALLTDQLARVLMQIVTKFKKKNSSIFPEFIYKKFFKFYLKKFSRFEITTVQKFKFPGSFKKISNHEQKKNFY